MKYKKAIICDFDGTLVPSDDIKKNLFRFFENSFVEPGGFSTLLSSGASREEILNLIPSDKLLLSEEQIVTLFSNFLEDLIVALPNYEGVEEFYSFCRDNSIKIFINSATPQSNLQKIINRRQDYQFVTECFGRPSSKYHNLQKIIKRNNYYLDNLLIIGNGVDDLEYSIKAGVDFIPVGNFDDNNPNNYNFFQIIEILSQIK